MNISKLNDYENIESDNNSETETQVNEETPDNVKMVTEKPTNEQEPRNDTFNMLKEFFLEHYFIILLILLLIFIWMCLDDDTKDPERFFGVPHQVIRFKDSIMNTPPDLTVTPKFNEIFRR